MPLKNLLMSLKLDKISKSNIVVSIELFGPGVIEVTKAKIPNSNIV